MISGGSERGTAPPPGHGPAKVLAGLRDRIETLSTSFHVALDTVEASRLRADPDLVCIPGFLLFDTGEYEPVVGLVPLPIFWRMQGMDILAQARTASRDRRAGPKAPPVSGSVWLVDGTLDPAQADPAETGATTADPSGQRPPSLRITALHALDRVAIEPRGPRYIESIDTLAMLPRFTGGS